MAININLQFFIHGQFKMALEIFLFTAVVVLLCLTFLTATCSVFFNNSCV